MTAMEATSQPPQTIDAQLREVFAHFPKIALAVLFGSVAATLVMDIDLA